MNWLSKIKTILGAFWHEIFGLPDFILGVEKVNAMFGTLVARFRAAGVSAACVLEEPYIHPKNAYPLYLDISGIRNPYAGFSDDLLASSASATALSIVSQSASGMWVVPVKDKFIVPDMITDNPSIIQHTLIAGVDYTVTDGSLYMRVNPSLLGLDKVSMLVDGVVHSYYICYGWSYSEREDKDAIAGFHGAGLTAVSADVWRTQLQGCTIYRAKKLIAYAAGSVVAEEAGIVQDKWTEGSYNCLRVGDRVYHSTASPNFDYRATVNAGDVLFGSLKFYTGEEGVQISSQIPSIRVMTDAGYVTVANASTEITNNILPVGGPNATAYTAICTELNADQRCPYVNLMTDEYSTLDATTGKRYINPFYFVAAQLRHARSLYAFIDSYDETKLKGVMKILGKSMAASSILNIYVRASTETLTVPVSCEGSITKIE